MAQIKLSIGQIGITDHLLVVLYKTIDPLAEYDRQAFAPPVSSTVNLEFSNVDPDVYFIDYRYSPEGTALGTLLGRFTHDAKNKRNALEMRFYMVGSGEEDAPAAGTSILSDPYLDGKDFIVYKEGYRPLVSPDKSFKEYDLHTGGGIELLNGAVWGEGEVIAVQIETEIEEPAPAIGGKFTEVVDITTNTTLDSTHYNKRLRCESNSSRLVISFAEIETVPEKTAYKFTCQGGNQHQVRLVGSLFRYMGETLTEISFMKGESLVIEKRMIGLLFFWEVYDADPALRMVGETFTATWKDHPTGKPEDGTLYDGDDWPRIWYWIKNKLPVSHYIVDDTVTSGGYTHPDGKEGQFVIHSTLKKFRLPNRQGLTEQGLNSFTTYGADDERLYDYPGGKQEELIGDHTHTGLDIRSGSHSNSSSALSGNVKFLVNVAGDAAAAQPDAVTGNVTGTNGRKARLENIGVIYMRRF